MGLMIDSGRLTIEIGSINGTFVHWEGDKHRWTIGKLIRGSAAFLIDGRLIDRHVDRRPNDWGGTDWDAEAAVGPFAMFASYSRAPDPAKAAARRTRLFGFPVDQEA